MVQKAKPTSDASNSGWVDNVWGDNDTQLWDELDEVTHDGLSSAINRKLPSGTSADSFEVILSQLADPGIRTNHKLKFWASAAQTQGYICDAKAELLEGSTIIKTIDRISLTQTIEVHEFILTDAEAESITDYNNLRVRIYPLKPWDSSSAIFSGNRCIFEVTGGGVAKPFFKPDGTKIYLTTETSNGVFFIYQYDLSTAWNVTTGVYKKGLYVGDRVAPPRGIFFKDDGTKMYLQTGSAILEYDLSTAWDINTAIYLREKDVSAQGGQRGMFFKAGGLKLYAFDATNSKILEYDLSSAWNITTATYLQASAVLSEDSPFQGLYIKPDGIKLYMASYGLDRVYEYDLTTAWDSTTVTFLQSFSVASWNTTPNGVFFKDDGTEMYVNGFGTPGNSRMHQFHLTTAWNVTTAGSESSLSLSKTQLIQAFFKPDGTRAYSTGRSTGTVVQVDFNTAWKLSTMVTSGSISVDSRDTQPYGLFFKPDGTKMYYVGNTGVTIDEWNLSTAWDVTTATYLQEISVSSQDTSPQGVFFKPDGLKMYMLGLTGDNIYQYTLTTPWDISTASITSTTSISAQEGTPSGLFIRSDGKKLYITGSDLNDINEYDLTTAWDSTTRVFVSVSSRFNIIDGSGNNILSIFFREDGTQDGFKAYTMDSGRNRLIELNIG